MERYALEEPVAGRQCREPNLEQAALKTTLDQVSDIHTVSKQLEPDDLLPRKRRRDSIEAAEASKAWNEERSFRMVDQRLAPSFEQVIQQKLQRFEQGLEQRVEEMIEQKLEQKIVEQFERRFERSPYERSFKHNEDTSLEPRLESMIEAAYTKWQPKEESTSAQRSSASHVHLLGSSEIGTRARETEIEGQMVKNSSILNTAVHDGIDGNIERRNHKAKKFFDSGFGSYFSRTPQSRSEISSLSIKYLNATIDERLQYTSKDERVRIAILDTGLDHHHQDFKQARTKEFIGEVGDIASPVEGECPQSHRIRKRRNFCVYKEEDENEDTADLDGHGTQVAGIILRLAPNADLYIARVCKGDLTYGYPEVQTEDKENKDFCKPQPSVVAKAIRWAVEEEVHIINLSLGFRRCDYADLKDLRDALKEAQGHKIVVFAATSNEGILDEVAWPAKDPEYAIGIHSSIDSGVRKSDFTANPFQPGANFMAVGENILSHWPNAKGAGFRLCTGSSFATPVATAIGALALAFIWQTICRVERAEVAGIVPLDDIRTNHGMTKVLKAISTPQDGGYLAIHSKLFWNNYHDVKDGKLNTIKSRGHAWDIIEKALRM